LTPIERIENIKKAGNEFFKKDKHNEANNQYYECLNEIEILSDSYKEKFKGEIEQIEILCRLNIAACKLKLKEYELVIRECNKIIKKKRALESLL